MADSLNKMFVDVPNGQAANFNTTDNLEKYADQIAFLHGAGTIATKNEVFTGGTKEAITVAGGPLADDADNWPQDGAWWDSGEPNKGNKQIPANVSLQEILTQLFLKTIPGTVSWNNISWSPKLTAPTVTITATDVEVGTKITPTYETSSEVTGNTRSVTLKASHGYFESTDGAWNAGGNAVCKQSVTGTTSGNLSTVLKWNDTIITSTTNLEVIAGNNTFEVETSGITANVNKIADKTVYASYNTKKILTDVSATLTDNRAVNGETLVYDNDNVLKGYSTPVSNSAKDTIKGHYKLFYGCLTAPANGAAGLTSAIIRSLSDTASQTSNWANSGAYDMKTISGKNMLVCAWPSSLNKPLGKVLNVAASNAECQAEFTKTTINVATANPEKTVQYDVWYLITSANFAATGDVFKFNF